MEFKIGVRATWADRTAYDVLSEIGASERQAVLVIHIDAKPHIHLVINRICPRTGVMLKSSKEKEKVQAWALRYEQNMGKIHCPKRLENHERRQRKLYTRGKKSKSRPLIEAERLAPVGANNNKSAADRLREKHKTQSAKIHARANALEQRQKREWRNFETEHKRRRRTIVTDSKRRRFKAVDRVSDRYTQSWRALRENQATELADSAGPRERDSRAYAQCLPGH